MAKNSQKIVLFVEEGFKNKIRNLIFVSFTNNVRANRHCDSDTLRWHKLFVHLCHISYVCQPISKWHSLMRDPLYFGFQLPFAFPLAFVFFRFFLSFGSGFSPIDCAVRGWFVHWLLLSCFGIILNIGFDPIQLSQHQAQWFCSFTSCL